MGQLYGINNFTQYPTTRDFDPRRGYRVTIPYKGTPSTIDALVTNLSHTGFQDLGIRFHRTAMPDGGYSLLTAFLGSEDAQSPTVPLAVLYDVECNDLEKSLYDSPTGHALFDPLLEEDGTPGDDYMNARKQIQDIVSGQIAANESDWWATASVAWKTFVLALLRGQESYFVSSWVLRRRSIIARNYTPTPALTNVDCVYATTAAMASADGIPATFLPALALPDGMWLKKGPKRSQIESGKWQWSEEWWWAQIWYGYSAAT